MANLNRILASTVVLANILSAKYIRQEESEPVIAELRKKYSELPKGTFLILYTAY